MSTAIVPPVVCTYPDDVATVAPLEGFRLHVRFHDGVEGIVDMSVLIHSPQAGVFKELADPNRFSEVYVEYGAVTWPGELDLAPDSMYTKLKENGEWIL